MLRAGGSPSNWIEPDGTGKRQIGFRRQPDERQYIARCRAHVPSCGRLPRTGRGRKRHSAGACEWVELQKPFLQRTADAAAHNQARNTDYRRAAQSDAGSGIKPCPHGASAILIVARAAHCRQGE
jgi:hypothetical protein